LKYYVGEWWKGWYQLFKINKSLTSILCWRMVIGVFFYFFNKCHKDTDYHDLKIITSNKTRHLMIQCYVPVSGLGPALRGVAIFFLALFLGCVFSCCCSFAWRVFVLSTSGALCLLTFSLYFLGLGSSYI
jgi:hypothetical protein